MISQARVGDSKKLGPNVHQLAVRGYDVLNLDEYMETFNDVSAAPERLIRRVVQSVATNTLKTLFPLTCLVNLVVLNHSHIFAPTEGGAAQALVYYTDIRFNTNHKVALNHRCTRCRQNRLREAFA